MYIYIACQPPAPGKWHQPEPSADKRQVILP